MTSDVATAGFYRMTPLERACGWLFGYVPRGQHATVEATSAVEALKSLLLDALLRPPCVIAFSGGRDSSVVLTLATLLAREHGLALPIPATRQIPGDAHAEETAWQTLMLHHLGLDNWVRLPMHDDYDLLGPLAEGVTARHGLLWPPTAYLLVPLLSLAHGGTLLTGEGGDSVFGTHRCTPLRHLLSSRPSRKLQALRRLPEVLGPRSVRRRLLCASLKLQLGLSWVRPDPRATLYEAWTEEQLDLPLRWSDAIERLPWRRGWIHCAATMQRLADDHDVQMRHPLIDPRFLAPYVEHGHPLGPRSRTTITRELFGTLLPLEVVRRRSKASFNTALMGVHSRDFVASWQGDGVDDDIVDAVALRREWQRDVPHAGAFPSLHLVWLRRRGLALSGTSG